MLSKLCVKALFCSSAFAATSAFFCSRARFSSISSLSISRLAIRSAPSPSSRVNLSRRSVDSKAPKAPLSFFCVSSRPTNRPRSSKKFSPAALIRIRACASSGDNDLRNCAQDAPPRAVTLSVRSSALTTDGSCAPVIPSAPARPPNWPRSCIICGSLSSMLAFATASNADFISAAVAPNCFASMSAKSPVWPRSACEICARPTTDCVSPDAATSCVEKPALSSCFCTAITSGAVNAYLTDISSARRCIFWKVAYICCVLSTFAASDCRSRMPEFSIAAAALIPGSASSLK